MRILELLLNALSVLFVAAILLVLLQRATARHPSQELRTGMYEPGVMAAQFPEVNWKAAEHTLVFYLQSACSYCRQSAPFHRELAQISRRLGVRTVALFPEPLAMARISLAAENLDVDDVYPIEGRPTEWVATPTIAFVDRTGTITKAWQGALPADRKAEILQEFASISSQTADEVRSSRVAAGSASLGMKEISAADLAERISGRQAVTIVDIRSREAFERSHLKSAVNIPTEELETRAVHEIDAGGTVAVFCQYQSHCEASYRQGGMLTNCTMGTLLLASLGFNAALLPENMATLEAAGIQLQK